MEGEERGMGAMSTDTFLERMWAPQRMKVVMAKVWKSGM